jgi:transposase
MASYGHKVLRLPSYHPELNPIEKIWASVKNWVAVHNTTFKLKDVEQLANFPNHSVNWHPPQIRPIYFPNVFKTPVNTLFYL